MLREALDILGARFDKLPERQRPHYTPVQRFRILTLKSFAGLSQSEAARLFRVSVGTIARWEAMANPASKTVGSTVSSVPPVRRYNDTVHHLVQTLAALGFDGLRSLAQHLARAGWKIGKTTAARYLREPRVLGPEPPRSNSAPPQIPKRVVQARFAHHVWHLDLTEIQSFVRSAAFSLTVVLDGASRMPLAWRLYDTRYTADDMTACVETALRRYGKPRHLVLDKDSAFTAHAFRERIKAWKLALHFCSADHHRANARLERFWLALKRDILRLRLPAELLARADVERDIARALHYYAHLRPPPPPPGARRRSARRGLFRRRTRASARRQPPRGQRSDPAVPCPVAVEHLDGDHRFRFLRAAYLRARAP